MHSNSAIIVIPVLNEADHIGALLTWALSEESSLPIWVVDGGSQDSTTKIAEGFMQDFPQVQVLQNPARVQSAAVNLAAKQAEAEGFQILVRLDAHAAYSRGFVDRLLTTLRETEADSVVVPLLTTGGSGWRDAAADLQNSWLGNGGAEHRSAGKRGWVEHGHHAAFRLERFLALDGYDTSFAANEDAEFDRRLIASGGRIFMESRLPVRYVPRANPGALARQMLRNGIYRQRAAVKHGRLLGLRQMLPLFVTMACFALPVASLWVGPPALWPLAGYGMLVLVLSLIASHRPSPRHIAQIFILAIVAHLSFGLGVLAEMMRHPFARFSRRQLGVPVT